MLEKVIEISSYSLHTYISFLSDQIIKNQSPKLIVATDRKQINDYIEKKFLLYPNSTFC